MKPYKIVPASDLRVGDIIARTPDRFSFEAERIRRTLLGTLAVTYNEGTAVTFYLPSDLVAVYR